MKRVIIGLVALVATPFVAGVSQVRSSPGVGHDAVHCAMRASLHPGTDVNKCDPAPVNPPPPPPPSPTPSPTCSATAPSSAVGLTIEGRVSRATAPYSGLQNWCVQLTGTVTAAALTADTSGKYIFSGLPDGTYTVCEVVQSGWQQTFPGSGDTCPTGYGWTFTLVGYSGSFVNFKNVQTP